LREPQGALQIPTLLRSSGRDDKGRVVAQVGVVAGCRSLHAKKARDGAPVDWWRGYSAKGSLWEKVDRFRRPATWMATDHSGLTGDIGRCARYPSPGNADFGLMRRVWRDQRSGLHVKALGARIRGVNKRLAAKHHTIGIHKLSHGVLDALSTGIGLLQKYCLWWFSRLQPQPLYGCFGLRVNSFRSMASPIAL